MTRVEPRWCRRQWVRSGEMERKIYVRTLVCFRDMRDTRRGDHKTIQCNGWMTERCSGRHVSERIIDEEMCGDEMLPGSGTRDMKIKKTTPLRENERISEPPRLHGLV